MLEHSTNIVGFQAALDCGVVEEIWRRRRKRELEETMICAVGQYQARPQLELACAGCEIRLEGVERGESGKGREGE